MINAKPAERCIFVNVNPEDGLRDVAHEPLKTLKKIHSPEAVAGPVMGSLLAIRSPGKFSVGDEVFVEHN